VNGFPEKVLLATDGLENTTLAARAAIDLAKGGAAEFHVVHVWHSVPSVHFDRLIRSGLRDAGREALEEQVRWIEEEGGTVAGTYLREGQAVEAIVFAVLGLRALYFALEGLIDRFVYLHYGLAVILVFVGAKFVA
jgi:nucleotide-binding universal stress UspA family protein